MTNIFSNDFVEHLSSELNCDSSDLTNAISSFFSTETELPKQVAPRKKRIPAKPKPVAKNPARRGRKTPSSQENKCERVPRGKTEACGKNAKNCVTEDGEEHWYCGTEKSGCYKSILGAQKRQTKSSSTVSNVAPPPKRGSKAPPRKPSTLADKKKVSDAKSRSLAQAVSKRITLRPVKIMINKKAHWYDRKSRVLFDRDTKEAYGILHKNNKDILPLGDTNIRVLEASGIPIRQEKSSRREKLSDRDEEDLDNLIDDVEDADIGDDEDIVLEDDSDEDIDLDDDEDIDLDDDEDIDLDDSDDDIDLDDSDDDIDLEDDEDLEDDDDIDLDDSDEED